MHSGSNQKLLIAIEDVEWMKGVLGTTQKLLKEPAQLNKVGIRDWLLGLLSQQNAVLESLERLPAAVVAEKGELLATIRKLMHSLESQS